MITFSSLCVKFWKMWEHDFRGDNGAKKRGPLVIKMVIEITPACVRTLYGLNEWHYKYSECTIIVLPSG